MCSIGFVGAAIGYKCQKEQVRGKQQQRRRDLRRRFDIRRHSMGAIYRFDLVGTNGSTMSGHVCGEYTVETALAWAFEHLDTGAAVPIEIVAAGQVVMDAAAIQAAYACRPLPADLLARLAAVGGACMSEGPSVYGSYEVLTPATAAYKYIWCSAAGLAGLLDEWEATPGYHPRLALIFLEAAREAREAEAHAPAMQNDAG
jgi:hypothetical protein